MTNCYSAFVSFCSVMSVLFMIVGSNQIIAQSKFNVKYWSKTPPKIKTPTSSPTVQTTVPSNSISLSNPPLCKVSLFPAVMPTRRPSIQPTSYVGSDPPPGSIASNPPISHRPSQYPSSIPTHFPSDSQGPSASPATAGFGWPSAKPTSSHPSSPSLFISSPSRQSTQCPSVVLPVASYQSHLPSSAPRLSPSISPTTKPTTNPSAIISPLSRTPSGVSSLKSRSPTTRCTAPTTGPTGLTKAPISAVPHVSSHYFFVISNVSIARLLYTVDTSRSTLEYALSQVFMCCKVVELSMSRATEVTRNSHAQLTLLMSRRLASEEQASDVVLVDFQLMSNGNERSSSIQNALNTSVTKGNLQAIIRARSIADQAVALQGVIVCPYFTTSSASPPQCFDQTNSRIGSQPNAFSFCELQREWKDVFGSNTYTAWLMLLALAWLAVLLYTVKVRIVVRVKLPVTIASINRCACYGYLLYQCFSTRPYKVIACTEFAREIATDTNTLWNAPFLSGNALYFPLLLSSVSVFIRFVRVELAKLLRRAISKAALQIMFKQQEQLDTLSAMVSVAFILSIIVNLICYSLLKSRGYSRKDFGIFLRFIQALCGLLILTIAIHSNVISPSNILLRRRKRKGEYENPLENVADASNSERSAQSPRWRWSRYYTVSSGDEESPTRDANARSNDRHEQDEQDEQDKVQQMPQQKYVATMICFASAAVLIIATALPGTLYSYTSALALSSVALPLLELMATLMLLSYTRDVRRLKRRELARSLKKLQKWNVDIPTVDNLFTRNPTLQEPQQLVNVPLKEDGGIRSDMTTTNPEPPVARQTALDNLRSSLQEERKWTSQWLAATVQNKQPTVTEELYSDVIDFETGSAVVNVKDVVWADSGSSTKGKNEEDEDEISERQYSLSGRNAGIDIIVISKGENDTELSTFKLNADDGSHSSTSYESTLISVRKPGRLFDIDE